VINIVHRHTLRLRSPDGRILPCASIVV
jgi:hypothetical protein